MGDAVAGLAVAVGEAVAVDVGDGVDAVEPLVGGVVVGVQVEDVGVPDEPVAAGAGAGGGGEVLGEPAVCRGAADPLGAAAR